MKRKVIGNRIDADRGFMVCVYFVIRGWQIRIRRTKNMLIDFNTTKEMIVPGMNICKKGSEHSIENTGDEDWVLLTIVVER